MKQISNTVKYSVWILSILLGFITHADADTMKLQQLADEFKKTQAMQKNEAILFAKQHKIPIRKEFSDGRIIEIQKIENGIPFYYTTEKKSTQGE